MTARRLGVVLFVLTVAAVAAPARAADAPGLSFGDDDPISLQAGGTVYVQLCNTGGSPAKVSLQLYPQPDAPDPQKVTASFGNGSPAAGTCADVTVTAGPSSAGYTGTLLAFAEGVGGARRKVTVAKAPSLVAAAFNSFDLSGHFTARHARSGEVHFDHSKLLFTVDGDPKIAAGDTLGTIAHDGDVVDVTAASPSVKAGTLYSVNVKVPKAKGQGVYKGTLDQLKDKDGNGLPITVTIADHWLLMVVVIALGALAGLAAKALAGRWLPGLTMLRHRRRLQAKYQAVSGTPAGYTPPPRNVVGKFVDDNRDALKAYAKTTVLFDSTASAYKQVRDKLAAAEADALFLSDPGPAGFAHAMADLKSATATFAADFRTTFPRAPLPAAAAAAEEVANPAPDTALDVGQATSLAASATKYQAFFDAWSAVAPTYKEYHRKLEELDDPPYPVANWWTEAAVCLGEVGAALRDVGSDETVDTTGLADKLRHVDSLLALVAAASRPERPAPEADFVVRSMVSMIDVMNVPKVFDLSLPALPFTLPEGLTAEIEDAAITGLGILGNVFALLISSGLALLVAAKGLYVGNAFGTWWDYVAAFALGAGADALVSGGITAVNSWRTLASSA